jgi:hypothetical protein
MVLIVTGLNFIYSVTLYQKDLNAKSKEIVELRNTANETDVYYFGESSNVTYDEEDSTKKSISELTASFFPGLRFTNINKNASHAGIYRHWLTELDGSKNKPKAVVVTLNLRSFGAAWIHSDLETALQKSLVMGQPYPPLINRFMLSLQAFDNKTVEQREKEMLEDWKTQELKFPFDFKYKTVAEWDNAMANGSYLNPDGSWNKPKIILACHYIKGYALNINEKNPRVKDLDAMVAWCEKKEIPLYLNLMAENVEYADSLVGKELVFLMRQNRDYLVKRYQKNNCKVVDNLDEVAGDQFIDQNWTTEHYRQEGRMKIAKNLADTLKKQFNNDYKKAY